MNQNTILIAVTALLIGGIGGYVIADKDDYGMRGMDHSMMQSDDRDDDRMPMGNMMGMGQQGMGDGKGDGLGQGRGQGDRPEEETKTGTFESRVRGKPERGPAVVVGPAAGPNKKGQAIEEIKAEIESAKSANDDPLDGVRLPKAQRELVRDYFGEFSK